MVGKKILYAALVGSVLFSLPWQGAVAAQVSPSPAADISHNGPSPTSATMVLQDGTSNAGYRTDCLLQNNGTHTLFYKFELVGVCPTGVTIGSCTSGAFAPTVTTADKQLAPGVSLNCNNGVTISSTALSILGTSGDTYALSEQFVRGQ